MKYLFVLLAICAVWLSIIAIAFFIPTARGMHLYLVAQFLTLALFYIGFYKR